MGVNEESVGTSVRGGFKFQRGSEPGGRARAQAPPRSAPDGGGAVAGGRHAGAAEIHRLGRAADPCRRDHWQGQAQEAGRLGERGEVDSE